MVVLLPIACVVNVHSNGINITLKVTITTQRYKWCMSTHKGLQERSRVCLSNVAPPKEIQTVHE